MNNKEIRQYVETYIRDMNEIDVHGNVIIQDERDVEELKDEMCKLFEEPEKVRNVVELTVEDLDVEGRLIFDIYVTDRQRRTRIQRVNTLKEGQQLIQIYENRDKFENVYEPNFYDIVDVNGISVIY